MITQDRSAQEPWEPVSSLEHRANPTHLLGLLRRRAGLIAFLVLVGLGLAGLYYTREIPKYESTAQILVMKKDTNLPTRGAEGGYQSGGGVAEDLLSTHMQLLGSERIVKDGLQRRNLLSLPSIVNDLDQDETVVEYVIDRLEVLRGGSGQAKDAHVLRVGFTHIDAQDAAAVLSAIIESYENFLGETFQDVSKEAVQLIDEARTQLAQELQREEADYLAFRENAPLLWQGDASVNPHQRRLVDIDSKLSALQTQRTMVDSRLKMLQDTLRGNGRAKYTDLDRLALIDDAHIERLSLLVDVARGSPMSEAFQAAQPVRTATIGAEVDQLLELRIEYRNLLADLGPRHPKVEAARQSIAEVEAFLDSRSLPVVQDEDTVKPGDVINAYIGLLQHDLAQLESRQKDLQDLAQSETDAAKKLIVYELQDESFRTRIDRKTGLYDAVLQRLREINLVKDYGGFITELISPVEVGERVWPRLITILGMGGFCGLMLGLAAAIGIDRLDRTFRNPEEIRQALELPIMAYIHKAAKRKRDKMAGGIDVMVPTYHWPKSRDAEAFRGLRTSLFVSNPAKQHKVVLVTSPTPQDGKSTIASNLAVSIAQAGKRVLLIDGDLRKPSIHRLFGLRESAGLSGVLVNDVELLDAVVDVGIPNLSVLPCGTIPPNPGELFVLPKFEQLIALTREQYDYIIIDSPPVLVVSDAVSIGRHVDGVLLAVRLRKNGAPDAIHARETIAQSGAKLVGVAVNNIDGRILHDVGHSYTYGYGASYGGDHGYYVDDQASNGRPARARESQRN